MNLTDQKILKLSHVLDLDKLSLREIGSRIGGVHPQTVKNSITKLKELGLIERSKDKDFIKELKNKESSESMLYKIPILGSANCGVATLLAEENFQGFLRISNSILRRRDNLFALIASGDSMNEASVEGASIDDGDYVIIDANDKNPRNNDYVLSVIEGYANIKKFIKDKNTGIISLISESSNNYPPIFIHEEDSPYYYINGKVVRVIKKPQIK